MERLGKRRLEEGGAVAPHVESGVEVLLDGAAAAFDPFGRARFSLLHELVDHALQAHGHADGLIAGDGDPLQGLLGDQVLDAQLGDGGVRNVGTARRRSLRIPVTQPIATPVSLGGRRRLIRNT